MTPPTHTHINLSNIQIDLLSLVDPFNYYNT